MGSLAKCRGARATGVYRDAIVQAPGLAEGRGKQVQGRGGDARHPSWDTGRRCLPSRLAMEL